MADNSEIIDKISTLGIKVDKINAMNPFSSYWRLNKLGNKVKKIGNEIDRLHKNYREQEQSISGYGFAPALTSTEANSKKISTIIQLERAYQHVSSAIDRKHSYVFGFISLYVALISLAIGVYGVIYSEQSRISLFTFEIFTK